MLLVIHRYRTVFFFNTIQPVSLEIIKTWSVTYPRTLESLQKLELGFLERVLIGIDRAIHEAAGPGLVYECQRLNVCETGDRKVSSGYKLLAKHVFHTVRLREKKDNKLNEFYKSCLQKVLAYNVNSVSHFVVGQLVFLCLVQGKLLKWH